MVFEEQPVSFGFYVVIALILAGAFFAGSEKRLAMVGRPDEREKGIRLEVFRLGFFLLVLGQVVVTCAVHVEESLRAIAPEILMLFTMLVCMGMGLVCLWKDAAFTAPEGRRRMTLMLGGLTLAEGVLMVRSFLAAGGEENPMVIRNSPVTELIVFLPLLITFVNFAAKTLVDAKRDAQEEREEEESRQ
ncbi:MAG: hypothetical protein IJR36_05605 [Lachnospiraceae bacterium]|nr:hypothetical protein [Lachnospiraceae bacterium]MBR0152535.1 hypothetical protein [Lachnospiraceae bacterium]